MTRKPVHTARVGQVAVRVVRAGHDRYGINWRPAAGGPRKRESFTTRADAIRRAEEIALALANSRADVLELSSGDRDNYRLATAALAPLGIPLHAAVAEYVAARRILGAHALTAAAQHFARVHAHTLPCPPTAQITAECLASLTNRRHRPVTAKTLGPLRLRFAAIARAFPDLPAVTEPEILAWLDSSTHAGHPIAAKTRDHLRDALRQLFAFAQRRGWIPPGAHAASAIARVWQPGLVATYTPAEMRAILAAAPRAWLPFLALGAFAGLRTSEIHRLRWEHFRWEEDFIALSSHVAAKTFRPRHVPILPNLAAWLAPFRRAFGPLYPQPSLEQFESALDRLTARLRNDIPGFRWKVNALRHSFVSHRIAATQNPVQTRLEAGHTEAMQQRHYNDPKTPREAAAWFAILPPWPASGIIALPAAQ